MKEKLQRFVPWVLRDANGALEIILLGLLLLVALPVLDDLPSWTSISAVGIFVWALLVAPLHPWVGFGTVALVALVAEVASLDFPTLTWIAMLLLVQVLLANAQWWPAAASAVVVGVVAFRLFHDDATWVVVMAGLGCALAVALIRRQLMLREEYLQAQTQLKTEEALHKERMALAGRLHNDVADSLTRVVLLAQQPHPNQSEVVGHAQDAVASLHLLIHQLKEDADDAVRQTDVVALVEKQVQQLRSVGFEVELLQEQLQVALVDQRLKGVVGELFTNVMKHGASPVRVALEIDREAGRLFMHNEVSESQRLPGSGMGLRQATIDAELSGATLLHRGTTAVLEFPVLGGQR